MNRYRMPNNENDHELMIKMMAEAIINIDFYGARDAGETAESIAEKIKTEPETIIHFLLDHIDNLTELINDMEG